jgi:hypothetical protein
LYYPPGHCVTDFLDETLTTVQYSKCNNIFSIIQKLGEHAKIGKMYIKSAFRPVPCYPGDFVWQIVLILSILFERSISDISARKKA